jgi:hypothetical protein
MCRFLKGQAEGAGKEEGEGGSREKLRGRENRSIWIFFGDKLKVMVYSNMMLS